MRGLARFRRRHSPPGTGFRRGISSRSCKLWFKGIRGPHGGYEPGRERRSITADGILCAAITEKDSDALLYGAALVNEIIRPVLAETERMVSGALSRINIDDMVRRVAVPK
jgi:DNA-binding IscR family transcriptional regulator